MKVPLNWLKEYVDIDISQEELVARLTAIGHMQDKRPENIAGDIVLDLEVRQNRSDCLSILGIAREVAAVTGKKIKNYKSRKVESKTNEKALKVINEAPNACYRFSAYKIVGINKDAQTPEWMKKKLEAYGMKTISPVVDITNFVMIETGEPMHAFDNNSVPDGVIRIRQAKSGEELTVLGDKTIKLTEDDLIVTDRNDTPISFSGLIGGAKSGIKEDSKDIILEAATYNQAVIRRSSIRHSVRTEASTRHEKFLHTELVMPALDRAVSLILEVCGGEVVAFDENYSKKSETLTIKLPLSEIKRLGGIDLDAEIAKKYLVNLNFEVKNQGQELLEVVIPFERTDILESADLVEEVLRIYGYENIESSLPSSPPPANITSKYFLLEENVRDHMLSLGFSEIITEPLTNETHVNKDVAIPLQNALNADKSYLRTSLRDGLEYAKQHATKHRKEKINIFEIGKIYKKVETNFEEVRMLGILIYEKEKDIEKLSSKIAGIVSNVNENIFNAKLSDNCKVVILDKNTVFCEIEMKSLPDKKNGSHNFFDAIPHFTSIDISLSLSDSIKTIEIAKSITLLRNDLYDLSYEENKELAPEGQKYVLVKLILIDLAENKEEILKKISSHLVQKFGATVR